MSMYGVNAGVPKTLVRHIVQYVADTCGQPVPVSYTHLDVYKRQSRCIRFTS